jgi:hypothetical protein
MQDHCSQTMPLCDCQDNKDIGALIAHMATHFTFQRFALDYHTLEPETGRMLCMIGQCTTCGKRLCCGVSLSGNCAPGELLADIYQWAEKRLPANIPDRMTVMGNEFIAMFHQEDQLYVRQWLEENQMIAGENRHDTLGG